jgi:hypothetical protein
VAARAVAIGPAPGQGHADHTGGQGAAKGQRVQAQAIECFGHGGHRGRDGQCFEACSATSATMPMVVAR